MHLACQGIFFVVKWRNDVIFSYLLRYLFLIGLSQKATTRKIFFKLINLNWIKGNFYMRDFKYLYSAH